MMCREGLYCHKMYKCGRQVVDTYRRSRTRMREGTRHRSGNIRSWVTSGVTRPRRRDPSPDHFRQNRSLIPPHKTWAIAHVTRPSLSISLLHIRKKSCQRASADPRRSTREPQHGDALSATTPAQRRPLRSDANFVRVPDQQDRRLHSDCGTRERLHPFTVLVILIVDVGTTKTTSPANRPIGWRFLYTRQGRFSQTIPCTIKE